MLFTHDHELGLSREIDEGFPAAHLTSAENEAPQNTSAEHRCHKDGSGD